VKKVVVVLLSTFLFTAVFPVDAAAGYKRFSGLRRPSLPTLPTLPSLPSTPSLPTLPGLPSLPTLPDIPDLPSGHQVAGPKLGEVRRGDLIAYQGNTGCSTGTHLHFGLYINNVAVNPKPYLDSGALRWPENNPVVTQWFGANYWWYWTNFGIPGHNGIDMTVGFGAPIYAAADGVAFAAQDSAPCWLTGTIGKGVIIDHSSGWKTIYWHIQ